MGDKKHCAQTDFTTISNIVVGLNAVELRTDKSKLLVELYIESNVSNTGIIYIGKNDIKNDGTNELLFLNPGDVVEFSYSDIENHLYAISDTVGQVLNVGMLLTTS